MPTIAVFHVSAGTGHTSAALALGAALRLQPGVAVVVEDVFDYVNDVARKVITSAYNELSTRLQPLYTMVHSRLHFEDTEDALRANYVLKSMGQPFLRRFERRVEELGPAAIICTMQWPLHVLQDYGERSGVPEYAVITDFSVQSSWLREGVAGYFVASELTRDVLLARGVDAARVHVTGIPVKLEIAEPKARDAMRQRLDLPLAPPLISVFGGGVAPLRVRHMVAELLKGDQPATVVTVAGRNHQLQEALSDLSGGPLVSLRTLGAIDYVDDLVAASDLVISKPGGLITSEVLARGTPLIVIDPVPGQEEWNADVVAGSGAGIQIRVPELVPRAVRALLAQPERLAAMRAQARLVGRPRAAYDIAARVVADLGVA
ncbi:MAG: UDP-N-acetylglucosamine--LPS N-acetylglucosamine transferase [Chloroflexi bacterium]|nr:UDP-N-acetylglucosamine--LPS N-acetylglucosamine transferase [Chloroflexota bacterium]